MDGRSFLFTEYNMRFFTGWCMLGIGSCFRLDVPCPVVHRYLRIQHTTNPTLQKLTRLDPTDPVVHRYLRIQHTTNPMVREMYRHIRARVVSSFLPESVFQDAVYECAEANQSGLNFFVQHLVFQIISHEVADYIHDALT